MRMLKGLVFGAAIIGLNASVSMASELAVVASIKPIHSLVATVMTGTGTPYLLVDGSVSPHRYSLKPSDAEALEQADVIVWVGDSIESFLVKPIETLGPTAKIVRLDQIEGLTLLPVRDDAAFEAHAHGEDEEHGHDHDHDHGSAKHDEHADKHDHHDDDHDDHHHHDHGHHGALDAHIWLDPHNAVLMANAIAEALANADPDQAEVYSANASALADQLNALTAEVDADMQPLQGRPFIVFHDAYQYFEQRFGVTAAGSITVQPETPPGARRVAEIRTKINDLDVICVFSEPQFEPRIVDVITEDTTARTGVLDPLGAELTAGPDLYPQLLRAMATSFKSCLAPSG